MIIFLQLFTYTFENIMSDNTQQLWLQIVRPFRLVVKAYVTYDINNVSVIFKCDSKPAWIICCCIHNMSKEWETVPLFQFGSVHALFQNVSDRNK